MQPLQAQIQAGKLRALAVTTAKRFPLLPDLPTIAESGYPGFEALAWNGVMVPAATPKPIIARLNAEMNAILTQHDVVEALAWTGVMVPAATPKPIIARLNAEMNAILKQPDVVEKMHASGFDLIGGTPEDFGNLIKRETDTWSPVIKKLGLKVD